MKTHAEIATLVIAAQNGNKEAYGSLVSEFRPTVYAIVLRRVRNHDDAQDIAQDVFVSLMSKLHQIANPMAFAGFLRRCAVNRAISHLDKCKSITNADDLAFDVLPASEPEQAETVIDYKSAVANLLPKLNPLDRTTLVEFYLNRKSIQQIANETGAPIGTIKRRLCDARKHAAEFRVA